MDFPKLSSQRRDFLNEAAARYAASLTTESVQYLTGRGFTREVVEDFQLGYVADPLPGHEKAHGWLSIPYRSPSGVTQIRFRRIDDQQPRWWTEPGVKDPLFNVVDLHRNEEYIVVCEGHTDTITMSGLVGAPAVGIAGAGKWEKHWSRCLLDYDTVFLLMDPDTAGGNATKKLIERLSENGNTKVVTLESDVNETFLRHDAGHIRKALGI